MAGYLPRLADASLQQLFGDLPAVAVVGPRGCGKTTTASRLVPNIVHLDVPAVTQAFRNDPDAALRAVGEPVLLDEWQMAPEVLGAVKRAVDAGSGAGRFLLTGSMTGQLDADQWPGTGRVTELRMCPMTIAELNGTVSGPGIIDRLLTGDALSLQPADPPTSPLDIEDYLRLALRSGFPDAAATAERSRRAWLEGYRNYIVARDSQLVREGTDPTLFGRFLDTMALNTATVTTDQTLLDQAGATRPTLLQYLHMLDRLYLMTTLPAWSTRLAPRLVKAPKRLLADAGLAAAISGVSAEDLIFDDQLKGRLIETFVAAQLLAEAPFAAVSPKMFHLRDSGGRHEIDILLEYPRRRIVAIEVKAAGTISSADARHLTWLRDTIGDAFICGVVLYTGPFTQSLGDRIFAAPISTCWAGKPTTS